MIAVRSQPQPQVTNAPAREVCGYRWRCYRTDIHEREWRTDGGWHGRVGFNYATSHFYGSVKGARIDKRFRSVEAAMRAVSMRLKYDT